LRFEIETIQLAKFIRITKNSLYQGTNFEPTNYDAAKSYHCMAFYHSGNFDSYKPYEGAEI